MLLAKGADLAAKGDDETAPMLAAKRGDSEVARMLGVSQEKRNSRLLLAETPPNDPSQKRSGPALALLEKQSHNFIRIGGCNSCHAQDLPSAAAGDRPRPRTAGAQGNPAASASMHTLNPERIMDLAGLAIASLGWEMFDFGNNGVPKDEYTDATVRYIKSMQTSAGHWDAWEAGVRR